MTEKRMTGPPRPDVTGRERSGVAGNVVGLLARRKADEASTPSPPVVEEETVVSDPEVTEQIASGVIDVVVARQSNARQSQNQKNTERVMEAMRDSGLRPL